MLMVVLQLVYHLAELCDRSLGMSNVRLCLGLRVIRDLVKLCAPAWSIANRLSYAQRTCLRQRKRTARECLITRTVILSDRATCVSIFAGIPLLQ